MFYAKTIRASHLTLLWLPGERTTSFDETKFEKNRSGQILIGAFVYDVPYDGHQKRQTATFLTMPSK